jgi:hypothetical protein
MNGYIGICFRNNIYLPDNAKRFASPCAGYNSWLLHGTWIGQHDYYIAVISVTFKSITDPEPMVDELFDLVNVVIKRYIAESGL